MAGGLGIDTFIFSSVSDAAGDVITDFSVVHGDRLHLRRMDADMLQPGDQLFAWIGDASFSNVAGQLQFREGVLAGDVNGDGTADFQIMLTGVASLTASSIWL